MTTARIDPLAEPRPDLTAAAIAAVFARHWDVHGEFEPLHGERDLNFRVTDDAGRRYVAKVHNPADTVGVVDFQTAAVLHIRSVAPDLPVSDVVPTRDGRSWITLDDERGRPCIARLLTYLDGRHPGEDELRDDDLVAWGAMVARVGVALRGFVHPESGYPIAWDIRRLPAVRDWTSALDEPHRRTVLRVIDNHERNVAAPLATVRAQIVHNDLALTNVLVGDDRRVSGITDFGDMTHTALVCDLAVTIADVLSGRDDWQPQAEAIVAGYASVTPLTPDEIALLPDLIAARCAAAMTISSWRDAMHDVSPGPSLGGWQVLQDLAGLDREELRSRFTAAADGLPSHRRRMTGDLQAARERVLGPLALSYQRPLHLVRGSGVVLEAADGQRYLDAYNNVPVLGHSHAAVTAAVAAQLRRLNTNTRYLHEAPIRLAEALLASMPPARFDRVLFVNSGSEANDLAWRIACFATGNSGAVVTDFAYHGVTAVTTALSPETHVDPAPFAVRRVPPPAPVGDVDATTSVTAAAGDLGRIGARLAAMFVDGVFTSDGVLGPAPGWTRAAADAVHAAGGLYVADEVQAGYGRTGDDLWSFAADAVDADMVTLGKPMGNGFPVAAVVTRADLVDDFMRQTDYFSTFGGNPVACAAALAVLDTIRRDQLIDHARAVGEVLRARLAEIASSDARLGIPRGWGLSVGVDVLDRDTGGPDAATAAHIVDGMRDRGVLIGRTAATGATLKIRPPLVFTEAHADRLVADLAAVLREL